MKKIFLIIILLILTTGTTKPQVNDKDSLDKLYNSLGKEDNKQTVENAHKLCKYYWNYSFDTSLLIANRAIEISKNLKNDSLWSMSELYLAMTYTLQDKQDSSFKYYFKAMNRSPRNDFIVATCANLLGVSYRRIGDHAKSEKYALKSLRLFKKIGAFKNYAVSLGNYSTLLQNKGEYEKAIEYSLKAAKILDSLNDNLSLARTYGTIANIYCDNDDPKNGIFYYKKGLLFVDKEKSPGLYFMFIFNLATTYDDSKKYDSAIFLYNQSLKYYYKVNDAEGIAIAHQNIGLALIEKKDYQNGILHLKEAYSQFKKLSTITNLADVLSDLGLAYQKVGNYDSSEYFLNLSIKTSKKHELIWEEEKAYRYLYSLFREQNKYEAALENYENYRDIQDSISNQQMKEKIVEMNSKYEAEKKDRKIQQLLLNKKIDKVKNRDIFIGIISFSIIIVLFISYLYTRQRNRSRLLQVKKKLLEAEKAELDKELDFKKKQLSNHALHMTQKNKILQSIRNAIEEVMPMIPNENKPKVRELKRELNKSLRYDKDWELFSFYFNELNKNFFDKLIAFNPKLSQHDLRLTALLKMNLNIKEAAAVLNIAPDSVKTARYKLRKKLILAAEDDLVKFIMKI